MIDVMAEHNLGHELVVLGNGSVPRPEEDRMTQADKNERLNQQLKVRILQKHRSVLLLTGLREAQPSWYCFYSVVQKWYTLPNRREI